MKAMQRREAVQLREQGFPIKAIAKKLGVSVGSVSGWVRHVILTEEQKQKLLLANPAFNHQLSGTKVNSQRRLEERRKFQEEGRIQARKFDPQHIAGCMLYWAEGRKHRNSCAFANSDPAMMIFFLKFLRKFFVFEDKDLRVYINCHTDLASQSEIETYWLNLFGLPLRCLGKTVVVKDSPLCGKSKRLKYGICSLILCKTRIIQHIFGAIQEYSGFNNESFLFMRL